MKKLIFLSLSLISANIFSGNFLGALTEVPAAAVEGAVDVADTTVVGAGEVAADVAATPGVVLSGGRAQYPYEHSQETYVPDETQDDYLNGNTHVIYDPSKYDIEDEM